MTFPFQRFTVHLRMMLALIDHQSVRIDTGCASARIT